MSVGRRAAGPRPVTPAGVLAADLADLAADLEADAGAAPGLAERARRAATLAGGLEPYVEASCSPASPALRELERRTRETDWSSTGSGPVPLEQEMLSGHVEGLLLAFLVRASRARRVLEVGLFTGYSALAMAEALPDGGEVVACERDAEVAALAREWLDASPAGRRVTVEVGPAADTLERLSARGRVFDLVFVDADKAGYAEYLDLVLGGGLLAPDGLVCVDNTLLQGEPWSAGPRSANGEAIAAFNRRVAEDPRVEQVVLPVRDGLTLIRRARP